MKKDRTGWGAAVVAAMGQDATALAAALPRIRVTVSARLPFEAAAMCHETLAHVEALGLRGQWGEAVRILRYLRANWREGEARAARRRVYAPR